VVREVLEQAKDDRADKGDCDIRGNNAQSADESHGKSRRFTSLPAVTQKVAIGSREKKPALLSTRIAAPPVTWLKNSESNTLKSP
jgi:hypothetical protein